MNKFFNSKIISIGLAIFSMFFGAANLMFPIMVGLTAGDKTLVAITGFMVTAIILPLLGLITMILYDGDYNKFFGRLGSVPGNILICISMFILGPIIAMPRIVTFSYTMMEPFLPHLSLPVFGIIFLALTFITTAKESKIMDILGYIISPILLISLFIIIIKGLLTGTVTTTNACSGFELIWQNVTYGYQTLDMLGGIFFASIVLTILKKSFSEQGQSIANQKLALISLKAGIIGTSLLGIIYFGLSYLGAYFGKGLAYTNEGELFREISFRILGNYGAFIISIAVLMACFSTIIALAAVIADYLNNYIFRGKVSYLKALIIVLGATLLTSNLGLNAILKISLPMIMILYPAFITLTFCNLAYKLCNFKPVKIPVLITLIVSLITYLK